MEAAKLERKICLQLGNLHQSRGRSCQIWCRVNLRSRSSVATLYVLNSRGDGRVTWAPEAAEVGDSQALAAVAEAEAIFKSQRAKGSSAFEIRDGVAHRVESFDRTAEETVLIPRMQGG